MVVAQRGLPSLWLMAGHPGRRGAGRRRGQRHQHGGRPRHRQADEAHQGAAAGHRGHDAEGGPRLRPHLGGGGVRRAGPGREPALGRPGRLGHPLLRLRLHLVAQAPLLAEHRDRRGRRGGARPGRLGGGDRRLSWAPVVLFAIIFIWTPPHFWSLAVRYKEDYAAADVPMLPVVASMKRTTREIVLYTVALVAVSLVFGPVAHLGRHLHRFGRRARRRVLVHDHPAVAPGAAATGPPGARPCGSSATPSPT